MADCAWSKPTRVPTCNTEAVMAEKWKKKIGKLQGQDGCGSTEEHGRVPASNAQSPIVQSPAQSKWIRKKKSHPAEVTEVQLHWTVAVLMDTHSPCIFWYQWLKWLWNSLGVQFGWIVQMTAMSLGLRAFKSEEGRQESSLYNDLTAPQRKNTEKEVCVILSETQCLLAS